MWLEGMCSPLCPPRWLTPRRTCPAPAAGLQAGASPALHLATCQLRDQIRDMLDMRVNADREVKGLRQLADALEP